MIGKRRRTPPWHSRAELLLVVRLAMGVAPWSALAHLFTVVRGKRVRGWNGLNRLAADHPDYYEKWIESAERRLIEHARDAGTGNAGQAIEKAERLFCLVLAKEDGGEAAVATVDNIRQVFGARAHVVTLGVAVPGTDRLDHARTPVVDDLVAAVAEGGHHARWFLPVLAGDRISTALPQMLAAALQREPQASVVFWDVDVMEDGRRTSPWLRGTWDRWAYLSRDTLGGASALAVDALYPLRATLGRLPVDRTTIARMQMALAARSDRPEPVHAAGVGSHWASHSGPIAPGDWPGIVQAHWPVSVEYPKSEGGPFREVMPAAPAAWPSVSIIVPTRDQPGYLAACMSGLDRLDYPGRIQRIVIDNGTSDPRALAILSALRARDDTIVVRDDSPFNFAAINNRAAELAEGAILCLLNNDVEATDGRWLQNLIRFAILPEVGAVGPLLTYPDGRIQHAGVAIGIGDAAGHVCRFARPSDPRHAAWHQAVRTVSAVTAACLVVRRAAYHAVGGLDEEAFAVAFNDIDFCLKLRAQGLANVFTPAARLIHHESVSRGDDMLPANRARFEGELNRFQERWGSVGHADPCYSPLFSRSSEQCLLRF